MTNSDYRQKIDRLWAEFWTGGITNPLTVIEQITYLMFCRLLDAAELRRERVAKRVGRAAKPIFFARDQQPLRWSNFKHLTGEELLIRLRDQVFPFLRTLDRFAHREEGREQGTIGLGGLMKDAQLLIVKPGLLTSAVTAIDGLDLANNDAKGDLYEYLLSKLSTAGINGQFRTPPHILKTMVKLAGPKPDEIIGDPACGTAGFLVQAMEYLRRTYTSPELRPKTTDANGEEKEDENGLYVGDQLTPYLDHINHSMFRGFDFDVTMLRLSAMNMMLHGVEGQSIFFQDSLSETFLQHHHEARGQFDLVLANPPFTGNLDKDDIAQELTRQVKTAKTELLFLVRMLDMLKLGGRCAVIVPDGVLFGSSKAHLALRQLLVDENQLEAVISLPSGVFKPYAGVSTAILYFIKGGKTGSVFYFDVRADGLSLDDKRHPVKENDLPTLLSCWAAKDPHKDTDTAQVFFVTDRMAQAFFVTAEKIRDNNYDLSLNRYREPVNKSEVYDPPLVIMERLEALEKEITGGLKELRSMLK
ncbi:DNA methyltransferase [Deltaproteobacteria bacterium]|nr:DNA methyltransferase [Deltaproteobacteria bacterium]